MNSQEFILWLKGFVDAVDGIPTQNQWDILKEKLADVKDELTPSFPIYTPRSAPVPLPNITFPYGAPIPVTCGIDTILTTTEGSGSSYSITTNGNTTSTTLPKGANVSYTANLPKELLTD